MQLSKVRLLNPLRLYRSPLSSVLARDVGTQAAVLSRQLAQECPQPAAAPRIAVDVVLVKAVAAAAASRRPALDRPERRQADPRVLVRRRPVSRLQERPLPEPETQVDGLEVLPQDVRVVPRPPLLPRPRTLSRLRPDHPQEPVPAPDL